MWWQVSFFLSVSFSEQSSYIDLLETGQKQCQKQNAFFSFPLFDLNGAVITLTSLSEVEGTWADCLIQPLDLAGEMTEV